ncbi:hypothetical protein MAP00_006450 [Monascus purpureus]|nr:hypothetical protein MAP00_006450 [Monascus purpureus]
MKLRNYQAVVLDPRCQLSPAGLALGGFRGDKPTHDAFRLASWRPTDLRAQSVSLCHDRAASRPVLLETSSGTAATIHPTLPSSSGMANHLVQHFSPLAGLNSTRAPNAP